MKEQQKKRYQSKKINHIKKFNLLRVKSRQRPLITHHSSSLIHTLKSLKLKN